MRPRRFLSPVTRRDLHDLVFEGGTWLGRLNELEFLSRLYDLEKLPSEDLRFDTAASDIQTHCLTFKGDWEPDWVWLDERFGLQRDVKLLPFLAEILHPMVRESEAEADALAKAIGRLIERDGFALEITDYMSGRPVYTVVEVDHLPQPQLDTARNTLRRLNREELVRYIDRLDRAAAASDTSLAIGTSKELVEAVCVSILASKGDAGPVDALPQLIKQTVETLQVLPNEVIDDPGAQEMMKRFRSGLGGIVHALAEMRNSYGTGHGRPGGPEVLQPHHARLAAGVATALATFLFECLENEEQG